MQLTHNKILVLLKLCFSAVLVQLFIICLALGGPGTQPNSLTDPAYIIQIPEMLEYAALSAVITLGGGLALEYALKVYG